MEPQRRTKGQRLSDFMPSESAQLTGGIRRTLGPASVSLVIGQDDSGGLQIRDPRTDAWIDAPPVANSFVLVTWALFWPCLAYLSAACRPTHGGFHDFSVSMFIGCCLSLAIRCCACFILQIVNLGDALEHCTGAVTDFEMVAF